MFEVITDKLQNVLGSLNSKGRLSESDIDSALREIRRALLESDVNFQVAREFVQSVRARTLESEVLNSVSPGQVVLRITAEELTKTLGEAGRVVRGSSPTSSLLVVGLNGSGKTTTAAKIASLLNGRGESALLVAADLFRPAAIDQLEIYYLTREHQLVETVKPFLFLRIDLCPLRGINPGITRLFSNPAY